jgi:hypothetical protein
VQKPQRFEDIWSGPAERSGNGAFTVNAGVRSVNKSGVALPLPPGYKFVFFHANTLVSGFGVGNNRATRKWRLHCGERNLLSTHGCFGKDE